MGKTKRGVLVLAAACALMGGLPGTASGEYQLIYVLPYDAYISASTAYPPTLGTIAGVAGADWTVTEAASDSGLIANWDGYTIVYHAAVLNLDGERDRPRARQRAFVQHERRSGGLGFQSIVERKLAEPGALRFQR